MSESCIRIDIVKEIPFVGNGDSLVNRLRKVSLKGFPDVKIYKDASFALQTLSSDEIIENLHTPQPHVYRDKLNRVSSLRKLFLEKGIDILHLNNAYDFIAEDNRHVRTNWTMISPVVESFGIPINSRGGFNYTPLIGRRLRAKLTEKELDVNPEVANIPYTLKEDTCNLINDGSHRIHCGVESKNGIKVIKIAGMVGGFPYYAVPQLYSNIKVIKDRDQKSIETKIHVVEAPGHKDLYRLFPSGGIMSGDVRSDNRLKE